jgi:hypothetical protein
LLKAIIPVYIICFALYLLFTRHPDFQDGEITAATIHFVKDSSASTPVAKAFFTYDKIVYAANTSYPFRSFKDGQTVRVIFETSNPSKAAVYSWWGYWIQWDELLASVLIPVIFLYAAKAITSGPSATSLHDQAQKDIPPE